MTRSFLTRAAIAAVLLGFGLASVWGNNSMFDRMISALTIAEVAIVMTSMVTFWIALALWVVVKLEPSKWAQRQASRGHAAAVLSVVAAACIGGYQPANGWQMMPLANTVQIDQPFTLSAEAQQQVDAAVAKASEEARGNPGFVVSVEMAIGIFIGAVVVGSVLYIVIRMVCSSLERMKADLKGRLSKTKIFIENPTATNAWSGAGLFLHRPATAADLPTGLELGVAFVAPEPGKPALLTASMGGGEQVSLPEFMADFGLTSQFPADSIVGQGVSRKEHGYQVAPTGFTNLVTLLFEAKEGVTNAYKSVLRLVCPAGSLVDFSDLSGAREARFWRLAVAP